MHNLRVALIVAAASVAGLAAATSDAQAWRRHGNCCGPLPTVHSRSDVNKVSHVTHFHDVWKKHYFDRPQYFNHTTYIHPVIYVSNVTRVHHEHIPVTRPVYHNFSEMVAPRYIYSSRTINIDEGCCCK